jgi:hypothetical protein
MLQLPVWLEGVMGRFLGLLLGAAVLAGCESSRMVQTLDVSNPETVGYIVGSVGVAPNEVELSADQMSLCDTNGQTVATFSYHYLHAPMNKRDFKDGVFDGNAFVFAVPAGSYRLCDSEFLFGSMRAVLRKKFDVPVVVQAKKTNYIGRYMGLPVMGGKNWFGVAMFTHGYWVVEDKQAVDWPEILKMKPEVANLPVVSGVPPEETLVRPLFFPRLQPQ